MDGVERYDLAEPDAVADDLYRGEYGFEDPLVHGDLPHANGEVLSVRPRNARSSLIRVREQFVDRLLSSAERL